MAARVPFVGGNWKSFNDSSKVNALISSLSAASDAGSFPSRGEVEVVVAPSALYLERADNLLSSKGFIIAAQNCSATEDGAYTGEISAAGLASFGLTHVIVGHSERRALFGETNEIVAEKVAIALAKHLTVIACVGETLEDRESGRTASVVTAQLAAIAAKISPAQWNRIVIAYEPVWAIGTGKVASPAQAQETHATIRTWLTTSVSINAALHTRIIYGGSVKSSNAAEIGAQDDIDGFLVGGASLVAEDFAQICTAIAPKKASL